jgi:hypothetical protein
MFLLFRLYALAAFLCFLACSAPVCAQKADVDPVKVLDEWLVEYHKGEIDMSGHEKLKGRNYQPKHFVTVRRGMLTEGKARKLTFEAELRLLCAEVAKRNDAAAAHVLLKVASAGLEQKAVEIVLVPPVVRAIGEEFAGKLTSADALQACVATARGDGNKSNARQGAALRVLAHNNAGPQRDLLEQMLAHAVPEVRMAAAEALRIGAQPAATPTLGMRLELESDERVAVQFVDALTATVVHAGSKIDPPALSAALDAAIKVYSKQGWRYQLVALDFFAAARSARTVPVLIETLAQYYGKNPPAGDKGSGLIPVRAHQVLQNLTKCVYPANRPDQWQAWWNENGTSLQVDVSTEPLKLDRLAKAAITVTNSFFGIPVAGNRVVFVVDISGSMKFRLVRKDTTGPETEYENKWALCYAELKGAIERLGADCSFNVIFFSTTAEAWRPKPVPASAANKKAFVADLGKINPDGGTNTWAGVQLALQAKSADPTVRVPADLDELFVLSDGVPSIGEVVDPKHILATVAAVNEVSKIRVNTVYIGGDEKEEAKKSRNTPDWEIDGPEFMRQMAQQNGGQFLHK